MVIIRLNRILRFVCLLGLLLPGLLASTQAAPPLYEVGTVTPQQEGHSQWHPVAFATPFSAPPVVVMGPMSTNGAQPAALRVRHVTASGFEFQLKEYDYLDGGHVVESISYLAMEEGDHSLGGLRWVAGRAGNIGGVFTPLSFSIPFGGPPVVLAQVESEANTTATLTRIEGVTADGFSLSIQLEEASPNAAAPAPESVGFIAVEPGTSLGTDGLWLETGSTVAAFDDNWTQLLFAETYPFPYFLAGLQSFNESDPAGLRHRNLGASSVELLVEEEASLDSETTHALEAVGYVVFSSTVPSGNESDAQLEFGELDITQEGPGEWFTVDLAASYSNPVVVAGAITNNDPDPGFVRLRNVTGDSFELQIAEFLYQDGVHAPEKVFYLVMEEGRFDVGGLKWEAGRIGVTSSYRTHELTQAFAGTPVILAATATVNEADPAIVRVRNRTADGFEIKLDEEEGADRSHGSEEVHYLAIDVGVGTLGDGRPIEVLQTPDSVTETPFSAPFSARLAQPYVLSLMQTADGGDTSFVRVTSISDSAVDVIIDEEASADAERGHTTEIAGLLVIGGVADADQDGLEDAWEQQIIDADPNDGINTIQDVLPGDDFDGDGLSNQQEFEGGTDPTDDGGNDQGQLVGGELMQWHRVDLSFPGPNSSESATPNPFLDYRLNVTFSQGAQSFVVPGYFAGDGNGGASGNQWRVHFAPPTTGVWNYVASFRTGADVNVSTEVDAGVATSFDGASGSFSVAASDKAGRDFRAADKGLIKNRGDSYLTFPSGKVWIKGGPDIPENWLAHPFTAHGGQKGALDYIASKGGNVIYFLPNNIGGDGKDTWPYLEKYSKDQYAVRFDISKLDGWEDVFNHATSQGIFLHFVLAETESANENYHDNGTLGVERKLFYRHLLARFGHHPGLQLNLGEENDYGDAKHKQFAAWIKSVDPYDHPLTTHIHTNKMENFYAAKLGSGDFDLTSFQISQNRGTLANTVADWRQRSRDAGEPWVISVDEPQKIENDKTDTANGYPRGRRDYLWPTYMSGGGGFEWYVQQDGGGHSFDQAIDDYSEMDVALEWTGYALGFLEQLPLLEMDPQHSLGDSGSGANTYVLRKSGEVYAMYNDRNGANWTLDLTGVSGNFEIKWFDPRNGGGLQEGTVLAVSGGGVANLGSAPNSTGQDWAAIVRNTDIDPPDPTAKDPDPVTCPQGGISGVHYELFHGSFDALPDFDSLTPVDEGEVANFDLSPADVPDNFALRYTGWVNVPTEGRYTFYTNSDDGSQLFIGNTLVVDNDQTHAPRERSGSIDLKPGTHLITVTFFEKGGGQLLEVRYSGPAIAKQLIPDAALITCAPDTEPNMAPTARITADPVSGNAPLDVFFVGTASSDPDGSIAGYQWTFGDGGSSTSADVAHTYLTPGTYTASLTVTDDDGATHTASVLIAADDPNPSGPVVNRFVLVDADTNADIREIVDGDIINVALTGASLTLRVDASGGTESVVFGIDGSGSQTENIPPYSMTGDSNGNFAPWAYTLGAHTVTATPYSADQSGGIAGATQTINFTIVDAPNQPPVAQASVSPTTGAAPLSVSFDGASSSDPDGTIVSYQWSFGDGATADEATASHVYSTAGTYTASLTVTDDLGASHTATVSIDVSEPPPGPAITRFVLVNAATDQDIRELVDGDTINLAVVGSSLTIRAEATAETESVVFVVDGGASTQTENFAPWSMTGDTSGNFKPWALGLGAHTLSATPYSQDGAAGEAGNTASIGFVITSSP